MSSNDKTTVQLTNLQRHVNKANIRRLRLFFELIGLGGERVEKEESLPEFLRILEGSEQFKAKPLTYLQYMLQRIGISEARTLGASQEDFDPCKKDLAYSSSIIELCKCLGKEDFNSINYALCGNDGLNCHGSHKDHTCEDLILKLHRQEFFKQPKIERVILELERANRSDLAGYVTRFNETGQFETFEEYVTSQQETTQATSREQSTPSENGDTSAITVHNGGSGQSLDVGSGVDGKDTGAVCCTKRPHVSKACLCTSLCLLLLALACGACTIGFAWYTAVQARPIRAYGMGGEMIVIAEFSDLLALTTASVSECLTMALNETSHYHSLYIISTSYLPQRHMMLNNSVGPIHRPDPDCSTNLAPNNFYLLQGSNILFEIWVESRDPVPNIPGTLLIFDNNDAFVEYTSHVFCPEHSSAALEMELNIGIGEFAKTSMTFTAQRNGYHYIIANTPEVDLRYRYIIDRFYLNVSGFEQTCEFTDATSCDLDGISRTPVYLVDAIQQNEDEPGSSTHVCLTSLWTDEAKVLVAVLAIFGVGIFFAVLLLSLVCMCCHQCNKTDSRSITV